ncbi:hypothetical protein [Marinomonas atlantica]|uniref:hypothetical protein n=1 Tax=Marinomonas atlantica TaxID=1806668 RepID=UPI000834406A|nr:hypothetical protein [Marinomonas atlantica]
MIGVSALNTALKCVKPQEIEEAFAKALSELVGKDVEVNIESIDLSTGATPSIKLTMGEPLNLEDL